MTLRAVHMCGCGNVATRAFADNGKVFAWKCRRCAAAVLRMLRMAARIKSTGVPGAVAVDWAVAHVNKGLTQQRAKR